MRLAKKKSLYLDRFGLLLNISCIGNYDILFFNVKFTGSNFLTNPSKQQLLNVKIQLNKTHSFILGFSTFCLA